MYPDSPVVIRFLIYTYRFISGLCIIVFRRCLWPVRLPLYMIVKDKEFTTKENYLFERSSYKLIHDVAMTGAELKKEYYYFYRTIARKYNWPYIQEVYDDSVYEPPASEVMKLPEYSAFKTFLDSQATSHLELKHARHLWWVLDGVISALTVGNFLLNDTSPTDSAIETVAVAVMLAVILQIFFVPPYVLVKLASWWAKRNKQRLAGQTN